MSWLIGRASALLIVVVSALLVIWVIPANTGPGYAGSLQPATMPTIAAGLMGLGALLSLFEPAARDTPDLAHLRRAAVVLGLLLGAVLLTPVVSFKWVAPLLCLVTMLMAGERRPLWLAAGTTLVPTLLWLVFEVGLNHPLP